MREPLFHFILIGIAIFGWFYWVSPEEETAEDVETITIGAEDVALLATRFEQGRKRAPDDAELQVLIRALVREEVLVREARKLGLDRGDQVIRARLVQKMDFLTGAIASSVTPEDAVLQSYLTDNSARFETASMIAFDQVFLGEAPEQDQIAQTLSALNDNEDWSNLGISSLLLSTMPLSAMNVVDATFGHGFSAVIQDLEPTVWSGPVQSGYGLHFVRVTASEASRVPPLEAIRDAVLREWRRETGEELTQAQYESFAAGYQVEMPPDHEAGQ
jgi:hypothetical protein